MRAVSKTASCHRHCEVMKQSGDIKNADCFVAIAPRNDAFLALLAV